MSKNRVLSCSHNSKITLVISDIGPGIWQFNKNASISKIKITGILVMGAFRHQWKNVDGMAYDTIRPYAVLQLKSNDSSGNLVTLSLNSHYGYQRYDLKCPK